MAWLDPDLLQVDVAPDVLVGADGAGAEEVAAEAVRRLIVDVGEEDFEYAEKLRQILGFQCVEQASEMTIGQRHFDFIIRAQQVT